MDQQPGKQSSNFNIIATVWLFSLIVVGVIAYLIGHSSSSTPNQNVAGASTVASSPTSIPTPAPTATVTVDLNSICEKSGPSQKKDYLVPYTLKEGDSFQSIAQNQLNDSTRVNELTALNSDATNLTVGSIIYLPPDFIKSSSGHIAEISGKIVKKDNGSWQISYGGGVDGPGILIPAFYLKDIPNLDNYNLGDCVTVLLDNGVKAYSIKKN